MQLIPEALRAQVPALYGQESAADPTAFIKLFTPDSNWTWYITELSPDADEAFGLVIGFETELGYFSIREIKGVRGPLGLPVERDIHFNPTLLSEVRKLHPRA